MASGLCLLGRGERRRSLYATAHVVFAAAGGAIAGLTLGLVGQSVHAILRNTLAVGLAALAAYLAIRPPPAGAGLSRQVVRTLERRVRPLPAYAFWGVELGSGFSTVIPYSAFLLLLAIELASGPRLAAAAGAGFGLVRQGTAVAVGHGINSPSGIAALLPRLAPWARLANLVVCFVGSMALMTEIVR